MLTVGELRELLADTSIPDDLPVHVNDECAGKYFGDDCGIEGFVMRGSKLDEPAFIIAITEKP